MGSGIDSYLEAKNKKYLRKSKSLSRRYLYSFIEDNLGDEPSRYSLNIGSGGKVENLLRKWSEKSSSYIISLDIDIDRKPDVVADASYLPFADSCFNRVFCIEVLEHVFHPHLAVGEILRILCPNGSLLLTTRFIFPLHDRPHDYFRFTKYGIERLLRGYTNVEIVEDMSWIETMAVLIIRLLKEDRKLIKYLSLSIYLTARAVDFFRRIILHAVKTDYISCGYFVKASKG